MADLVASSANPLVTFHSTTFPAADWWRHNASSSTQIALERFAAGSWHTNFAWTSSGNTSFQDLDINKASPALTLTDTGGGSAVMTLESDGALLTVKDGATTVFTFDAASTNTTFVDFRIYDNEPILLLENTATYGRNFQVRSSVNGSNIGTFNIDLLGTDAGILLNCDADTKNWYIHDGGLASGSTAAADAIRWNVLTGNLAAAATTTVSSPYTNKILGALVMISTSSDSQSNQTYQIYDYKAAAQAGVDFFVQAARNIAAVDTVTITYHANYQGGFYKVILYSEA